MKIYFIRHGHPNYKKDCLTELGHLQAAAAAIELSNEKGALTFPVMKLLNDANHLEGLETENVFGR